MRLDNLGVLARRVRVFGNYAVLYPETNEIFDAADLYWIEDFDAGRAGAMADEARELSLLHPTDAMRRIYARCHQHLDFEAQRLAAPHRARSYVGDEF